MKFKFKELSEKDLLKIKGGRVGSAYANNVLDKVLKLVKNHK